MLVLAKSEHEAADRAERQAEREAKQSPVREYIATEVCEEPKGPCFRRTETEFQVLWEEKPGSRPTPKEKD